MSSNFFNRYTVYHLRKTGSPMTGSTTGITAMSSPNGSVQASNDDRFGFNGFEAYFERSTDQNPLHDIPSCPPQVRAMASRSMSKESQGVENKWLIFHKWTPMMSYLVWYEPFYLIIWVPIVKRCVFSFCLGFCFLFLVYPGQKKNKQCLVFFHIVKKPPINCRFFIHHWFLRKLWQQLPNSMNVLKRLLSNGMKCNI